MNDNLLFLDCETFYDTKTNYCLQSRSRPQGLSTPEYVRDERFKLHGIGLARPLETPYFATEDILREDFSEDIFVGHNLKFDGFIFSERYGIKPLEYRDTKSMAKAVLGRKVEDYKLATLAKYFGLPEKGAMKVDGVRDLTPEQKKELADYCLHDVWLTREIYNRLAPEFPEHQYPLMDQTIRMFVEPKLELNVPLLAKTAADENKQKIELFTRIGIDKEVFSSNQKFSQLLKDKGYVVPTKKSPRTGAEIPALALGDPEFLDLFESEDEALKKLCEARREAKSTLMETRSEKLAKIGRTGPWPFDVEFSGAVQTHRYSGGGSAGGNPQNFTRDSALREAVQAPEGYSLVVGDFSNIEMRLVAYLSGDRGLVNAIEKNEDIYCNFASAFYRRKITKKDDQERRFGKTAILGLGYGMGATKFQRTVRLNTGKKISTEDARKAVNLYRALYSGVPTLWKQLDSIIPSLGLSETGDAFGQRGIPVIMRPGELQLPSGLKIQYPDLKREGKEWTYEVWGKKGQKERAKLYGGKVLENICQALAGELCKDVMRKFGSKVVGQVHDEILLLSDDPETDRAELEAAMTISPSWLPGIKLEAEVGYGRNWAEAKHG